MEGSKTGLLVTRVLQFVFAAVVLGLAAYYANGFAEYKKSCEAYNEVYGTDYACDLGRLSAAFDYSTFTGAFGLLDVFVGFVALGLSSALFGWITIALDGLAVVFFLAGGINLAVIRNTYFICDSDETACSQVDAATAFQFLGFAAAIAAAVLVGLRNRS